MKKIILFLHIIFIMSFGALAFADDGAELQYFYDFENYYASSYGTAGPDALWDGRISKNMRSFNTEDSEHGKVMEIKSSGRGVVAFPKQIKQGELRLSFDLKFKSGSETVNLFHHAVKYPDYDSILNDTINWYAKVANIGSEGKLKWYKDTNSWDTVAYEKDIDFTEWHHYDVYYTEMSDSKNFTVDIYLDGEKVNEKPIPGGNQTQFWTVDFRVSNGDGVYIDNLYLHRYTGEEELSVNMIGSSYVAQNNGEMRLYLNDYVDESLISKENISITNKITGEEVENFSVESFSEREFIILFDGSIDYGDYEFRFISDVAGRLFGGTFTTPFEFRTEYKPYLWEATYLEESFDGYTDETGTLPEDFVNVNLQEQTFAKSVTGSSGEENDRALGFVNMANNSQTVAYMRKLMQKINSGDAFDVEFDIYADNTAWYMYVSFDDECVSLEKILNVSNSGDAGYFANTSQSTATQFEQYVELQPKEWHRIKIHFNPDEKSGKTKVNVIFDYQSDNEKEYAFETTVDFLANGTTGIGFGYLTSSSADKMLAIDNFKISSSIETPYPDVSSIKLYDAEDVEINTSGKVKPEVYKAVIEFNTKIAENQGEFISFTKNGESIPFEYETILNDYGRSEIIMYFQNLLEPLRTYNIEINEGIMSAYASEATLFIKKGIRFDTNTESEFRVVGIDSDGTVGSKIQFIKSDNSESAYVYAMAIFKDKEASDGTLIPVMVDFEYNYIKLDSDDEGVFISSLIPERELEDGEYVKYYCVEYPSLNKLIP